MLFYTFIHQHFAGSESFEISFKVKIVRQGSKGSKLFSPVVISNHSSPSAPMKYSGHQDSAFLSRFTPNLKLFLTLI